MLKNIIKRKKELHEIFDTWHSRVWNYWITVNGDNHMHSNNFKISYIDNNSMQHPEVFVVSIFQARRKRMQ